MEKTVKDEKGDGKNPMREAVRGLEARDFQPGNRWRSPSEKADEAKVAMLLEKSKVELSAENIAVGVEMVEKRIRISPENVENARALKRLGSAVEVSSETMNRIHMLKEYRFDVAAKTVTAPSSTFANAKEALNKTIHFYPRLMDIVRAHTPEARQKSLKRLEEIADFAPAKASALLEGMKNMPFYKNDIARFLATAAGKDFEAYLKGKLEAKKKEGEGSEEKPQTG